MVQIIMDGKEVSEDVMKKLINNKEVVTEYEKWKVSQTDSETLYQILAKHLADEMRESGDHNTAIQLYTDILAYQTEDKIEETPDQTEDKIEQTPDQTEDKIEETPDQTEDKTRLSCFNVKTN